MDDKILVPGLWDDGNAYSILGKCRRAARKAGWTEEQMQKFSEKAKAGDYDHLVFTVLECFDEQVDED